MRPTRTMSSVSAMSRGVSDNSDSAGGFGVAVGGGDRRPDFSMA